MRFQCEFVFIATELIVFQMSRTLHGCRTLSRALTAGGSTPSATS
jgi:hypothetical protein